MKYIKGKEPIVLKIESLEFKVVFSSPDKDDRLVENEGCTDYRKREIVLRDNLDLLTSTLIFRHEIVHAILYSQGRGFTENFNVEDMCEFIAFNYLLIDRLYKEFLYLACERTV